MKLKPVKHSMAICKWRMIRLIADDMFIACNILDNEIFKKYIIADDTYYGCYGMTVDNVWMGLNRIMSGAGSSLSPHKII